MGASSGRPKWVENSSAGRWRRLVRADHQPPGPGQGHPCALTAPTARAGGAGRGRHCSSGSRVEGPGGPALPAVPEIPPPARATRARNAPAGRAWCSGARRRRRLPQRGVARRGPSTPRPCARRPSSEAPAVPAQPEPRAHLTSQPPPRRPARPLAGRQAPRMRKHLPLALAPPPRGARAGPGTSGALRVLAWSASGPWGMGLRLQDLSSSWGWGTCSQAAFAGLILFRLTRLCLFGVPGGREGGREGGDLGAVKARHPLALPGLSQSQQPGMLELTLPIHQGRRAGRGSTEKALSPHIVIMYCN